MSNSNNTSNSPIQQKTKQCSRCKQNLPATTDYFHRRGAHSLRSVCKKCRREYYAEHREEEVKRVCEYQTEHRVERAEYSRQWRDKNREVLTNRRRQWYIDNREGKLKRDRQYYAENRERLNERNRKYYEANREAISQHNREYHKKNPLILKAGHYRRKARKRGLPDSFTTEQITTALSYWKHRCAYCGGTIGQLGLFDDDLHLQFDHFIPLADPSPDNPGTVVTNMLPTCQKCNLNKRDKNPVDWLNRKFGKRKAKRILAAIKTYFAWVATQVFPLQKEESPGD